jgi:hypothetical protein
MMSFSVQSAALVLIWCHCCLLWRHRYLLLTRCWHLNADMFHVPSVLMRFCTGKNRSASKSWVFHGGLGSQWGKTSFLVRGCKGARVFWLWDDCFLTGCWKFFKWRPPLVLQMISNKSHYLLGHVCPMCPPCPRVAPLLSRWPVFEKSSTPKFEVDDVRFLKKFGTLSFKIWNFWKSLARCHSKS